MMRSQSDVQSQSDALEPEEPAPVPHFATPASEESVRALAYRLWERRGRPIGTPELDWLEAERMYEGGVADG